MTVRVAIAGTCGRMGQALIDATLNAPDLTLAGALDVAGSPLIGVDAGEKLGRSTGVRIGADIDAVADTCDVLIDFTRPAGTLAHLAACARARARQRLLPRNRRGGVGIVPPGEIDQLLIELLRTFWVIRDVAVRGDGWAVVLLEEVPEALGVLELLHRE